MSDSPAAKSPSKLAAPMLGAIGVVFGDIGTSPIYTLRESFKAAGAEHDPSAAIGVLSLVVWTIMVVVTIKYVILVMRADNDGEGGIIALLSAVGPTITAPRARTAIIFLGLAGASLFFGDGMITPAISVLSAIEGLKVSTPIFDPYVVPITLVILILLFLVQSRGSEKIGRYFGPVMLLWFAAIGLGGLPAIVHRPEVLQAIDPLQALSFCAHAPARAFVTLGSVFLAVTGAEALYADMGHFGRTPIRIDWLALVLPALLLNYAGQAATVLDNPASLSNPFFLLFPGWALFPMVILAACATVIASQAVLSGAFSLTQQAMQSGLMPRLEVRQTSATSEGQVYVPVVNWLTALGVIILVLAFRSSDALGAAYGIAVTGTMVVTAILLILAMRNLWHWPLPVALAVGGFLLAIDCVFFVSNALKIPDGGYAPLAIGAVVFLLMQTWRTGRTLIVDKVNPRAMPIATLVQQLQAGTIPRTKGTGVFLTNRGNVAPAALCELLRHVGALHETLVLLTIRTERQPTVAPERRAEHEVLAPGLERVVLHFGFAEAPNIPDALEAATEFAIADDANYFSAREIPVPSRSPVMARWRQGLFRFLVRNAISAARYYSLPPGQVVEMGARIEL